MAELKPYNHDETMIDLFSRALYLSQDLPFYSAKYPAYRFLPKNVKEDMRRMGKAAYKEYINMVAEYAWNKRS